MCRLPGNRQDVHRPRLSITSWPFPWPTQSRGQPLLQKSLIKRSQRVSKWKQHTRVARRYKDEESLTKSVEFEATLLDELLSLGLAGAP
jgi:hypothetical protein